MQRAADNPTIVMENGVQWERLAVEGAGLVDPLLTTYEPGSSSSVEGKLMRHSGIEYGYIIRGGEVTLALDFDVHVLRAGDSICFDSRRPHLYENRTDEVAQGLWFVLGRSRDALKDDRGERMSSAVDVLGAMGRLPVPSERRSNVNLP